METLSQKQQRFSWSVAKLILYAGSAGYEVTFGEAYRTQEQAAIYAKHNKGILKSLHCDRLAVDLNLFREGKYLKDAASYKVLGDWWKLQGADYRWGGDFKRYADLWHFSIEYHGRA